MIENKTVSFVRFVREGFDRVKTVERCQLEFPMEFELQLGKFVNIQLKLTFLE